MGKRYIFLGLLILVLGLASCQPTASQNLPTASTFPPQAVFTDTPSSVEEEQADTPEPTQDLLPEVYADMIFINGPILTMDPANPRAEALAVAAGMILAAGSEEQVLFFQGPETTVVDLEGSTMLPGFVDAHTHLFNDHEFFETDLPGAQDLALSNGITTLGNMYAPPEFVEEMRALDAAGDLLIHTSLYLAVTTNCGDLTGDWWRDVAVSRNPGDKLHIGGLKVFADGGTCKRLAGTEELLPGYGLGDLFFTQEEMNAFLEQANTMGFQLAIHAQGDRAIDQALESFATVLEGNNRELRHRIEHNAMVRPDQLPLYTEYDVVATLFGYNPVCDMPAWTDFYIENGEDLRTMLDANPDAHLAWHGDDPGVPPISPLLELASMVTRQEVLEDGTKCEPPDWLKDKAITVEEALQLMTMGSAYALFREEEVGSLEPGKFADLVILSADPTQIDPDALWDLELLATIVNGEVEYCAAESSSVCDAASQ